MEFTTQHYVIMGVAAVVLFAAAKFLGLEWGQLGHGDTDYDCYDDD